MEKNKLPVDKVNREEKKMLLKSFLRHFHYENMSPKETRVIELLRKTYNPVNNAGILTDKDLNKAVRRNRKQILKKINTSPTPWRTNKTSRYTPVFIGGSVAAITLLVICFITPFPKSIPVTEKTGITADSYMIEKQFIAGDNMKKIVLADGSTVFLNKGTTVSLRTGKFNAYIRELWLDEGEAFFQVTKDADRPFVVHTSNGIATKVLGTSFNIRAYAELEEQVISVNTGRVQVYDESDNKIILDPDYKVSIKNGTSGFLAGKTDAHNISAWRSGAILLEDATIKEVAFRLKQVFDIDLIYGDAVDLNEEIVTSFTPDMSQEEVIMTICKLYGVHYERDSNRVILIK